MKRTLFFFTFFLLAIISVPNFVSALTVSPAKIEISGDPGQKIEGEIKLLNEDNFSRQYFISYENFEPRGDSGAPYFIGAKSGLATWIYSEKQVTLQDSTETVVPFSITIPSSAKPGGYFSAIFFGNQPPTSAGGGEVSVGGKVGVLILLRVNGEIEESGGLLDFALFEGKRFVSDPELVFEYRFNNTGGDRVVPRGDLIVRNTFRFKTEEVNANKNEGSVLPGSMRKFEVFTYDTKSTLEEDDKIGFFAMAKKQFKDFKFGWYTARLSISWGQTNQSAQDSYHFFVVPWQALIFIIVGLLLVLKTLGLVLKRYKIWVLKQAGVYHNQQTEQKTHTVSHHKKSEEEGLNHKISSLHNSETRIPHKTTSSKINPPLQKPKRRI